MLKPKTSKKKEQKKDEQKELNPVIDGLRVLENKYTEIDVFHESKAEVAKLRKEIEKGRVTGFSQVEPLLVFGLIKATLLEKPLIGLDFYEPLRAISEKLNDVDESIKQLRELAGNLGENKNVLRDFLFLLKKICQAPDKKQDIPKVASALAPCIIKKKFPGAEPTEDLQLKVLTVFLITHSEAIFLGGEKEPAPAEVQTAPQVEEEEEAPSVDDSPENNPKKHFYVFSPEVYECFASMMKLARDQNVHIDTPSICIIGQSGSGGAGTTAFLEAFLGHPVSLSKQAARKNQRFVTINLVNNPRSIKPHLKIKGDASKGVADEEVDVASLPAELEKRTKVASDQPLFITYESNMCFNLRLIDTPPINLEDPGKWLEEAQNATYIILCFKELPEQSLLDFAQKADPRLNKTFLIHTDFFSNLKNYVSTAYLNRYLVKCCHPDIPTYLTTLSFDNSDVSGEDLDLIFKSKLVHFQENDLLLLEKLNYDRSFENKVGFYKCRKTLVENVWKKYQELMPEVPKTILQEQKKVEYEIKVTTAKINQLEPNKLREVATSYTIEFLQNIEKLMVGSLEGVPAVNGQTLEEEKAQQQDSSGWLGSNYRPLVFKEEYTIPTKDSKLYGKQQFERVLVEFKAVAEHMSMNAITIDDVATSAGSFNIARKNVPLFAWVASDLASRNIIQSFTPLIEELHKRLVYVMLRAIQIADAMQKSRAKADAANARPVTIPKVGELKPQIKHDFSEFPYLISTVKNFYSKFVLQCASTAKQKAQEELVCNKVSYWEHLHFEKEKKMIQQETKTPEEARKAVVVLSTEMFNDIRKRILRSVLMKYYEYLLVPVQTKLSAIQNQVTYLPDQQILELFQVGNMKRTLDQENVKLNAQLKTLKSQHKEYMDLIAKFKRGQYL